MVFMAGIHIILFEIENREDPDQTASEEICSKILNVYSILNGPIDRPPKSAYWKTVFFISHQKTYVLGTQKNRLNETVLFSTQNTCKNSWVRK